ncbi:acanthoscurrin-2-like isoform X3 [Daphnia carinata]|uniref:acanthoscurrin-2-like isoform X3 n=1 Tax=Daphnia carinata TaxID=120202 RepID=UPI002868B399|nr:acanthoscurrin-2-like isoform X3 [Daphnia carinata]
MNKVLITLALLLAVTMAAPQGRFFGGGLFGRPVVGLRPIGGGFGGSGSGAGAGTGSAGLGGVSASGVALSNAQNGGFSTSSGSGLAGSNFFTGQNFATGDGSSQSSGK